MCRVEDLLLLQLTIFSLQKGCSVREIFGTITVFSVCRLFKLAIYWEGESLHTRRQKACDKLFKQILEDPNHKLNDLIPRTDVSINYQLRNDRKIHVPNFCTERFKNTYIIVSCLKLSNQ